MVAPGTWPLVLRPVSCGLPQVRWRVVHFST
jgi:hypothetical protein